MVVIGHVDAGKSTLMGQLLVAAGKVDASTLRRAEREAEALGKASFRLAFLLDLGADARAHGVTTEVGAAFFETPRRQVNVLDAPGHRDFVPEMIGGAAQADAAVLVLNAARGEFEAGLAGQTREHLLLARALGVSQLLVAVNQMDAVEWQEARFNELVAGLTPLLRETGFAKPTPTVVPVAALHDLNLRAARPAPEPAASWYTGPTLLDAIDALAPAPRAAIVGARLCINDVFPSAGLGALAVSGTLQSGQLHPGDRLMLMPGSEQVQIKVLQSRGAPVTSATAGDHVELGLASTPADAATIGAGSVNNY